VYNIAYSDNNDLDRKISGHEATERRIEGIHPGRVLSNNENDEIHFYIDHVDYPDCLRQSAICSDP
jgi:hypothetical protein